MWRPVLTAGDAAWARTLGVSAPSALFADTPRRRCARIRACNSASRNGFVR